MKWPQLNRRARGEVAERLAERWLSRQGLSLIKRNHNCRVGEIDLIMRDQDTVVFVEVRARAMGAMVDAASSVTARKQRRVIQAARHFLAGRRDLWQQACRFDVLALDGDQSNPEVNWIRGAFQEQA